MIGRCETCKHWGAGIAMKVDRESPEIMQTEDDGQGHKVCALTITHGHFSDALTWTDTSTMPAYSDAYDGEPRGLWTLPAFGCVQWESHTPPPNCNDVDT
jgi:hypothetical protein